MRLIVLLFLALSATARPAFANDAAYQTRIYGHLAANSQAFPQQLKDRSVEIDLTLTLDRGGKLLGVTVDKSSGSPGDNANALTGIRRMAPFPAIPEDVQAPYKMKLPLTFVPTQRLAFVTLKGSGAEETSEQAVAFRRAVLNRLYRSDHRPLLPTNAKKHDDARSVMVFSIDRDGALLDATVTRSFGLKTVDENVLAWLKAAAPFPGVPLGLVAPMKLTAEIAFGLARDR